MLVYQRVTSTKSKLPIPIRPIASRQTQALHLIHIGALRLQPGLLRLRQVTFGPEIHQRNLHEVVDLILGAGFRRMDGEDGRRLGTFELASIQVMGEEWRRSVLLH